jgi:preprotein translocase subunit SecG
MEGNMRKENGMSKFIVIFICIILIILVILLVTQSSATNADTNLDNNVVKEENKVVYRQDISNVNFPSIDE